MTYDQILSWQYSNALEDDWFIAVAGNPSPQTKPLLEIKAIKDNAPQLQIQILHVSNVNDVHPNWILFESQEEINAQLIPQRPLYNGGRKCFNATMEQMLSLARRAVLKNKFTVTSVDQGFVAFETGVTWGSWSGASCSITIDEVEPYWFSVSGSGKQNVRGGQLVALDFGEAARKAKKVIITMQEMASL